MLHAEPGYGLKAMECQEELQKQGELCELSLCGSREEYLAYGKGRKRAALWIVGEKIEKKALGEGEGR